jgi:hypothetical protein
MLPFAKGSQIAKRRRNDSEDKKCNTKAYSVS